MLSRRMGAGAMVPTLLLSAMVATAQPLNQNFILADDMDPNVTGNANHSGASNSGTVRQICRNGFNVVTLSGATTHPTQVKLSEAAAVLRQKRGEGTSITMRVQASGAQTFNLVLSCEKSDLRTKVTIKSALDTRSLFQFQASQCSGLNDARAAFVVATCEATPINKKTRLVFEGNVLEKIRIVGKGFAY